MRKPTRPGGVTAIAIINIVLGSLGLLLGLCSVVVLVAMKDMINADPNAAAIEDFMRREAPMYTAMQWASNIVTLLQATAFLVTGIGLLNLAIWARRGSILFALLSIFWLIWVIIYQFAFSLPAMNRFFRNNAGVFGPGPNPQTIANITVIIVDILYVALIIYAIVMIGVLRGKRATLAFAGQYDPDEDADRFRGEDDNWRPRDRLESDRRDNEDNWPRRRPERSDGYDDHVQ